MKPDVKVDKKKIQWGIARQWAGAWWQTGAAKIPDYARDDGKGWKDDNAGGKMGTDEEDLDP